MYANKRNTATIFTAFAFSILIPAIGYYYIGLLYAIIFLIGYFGGFLCWLIWPSKTNWKFLKAPYWSTLLAFILLHKLEENKMKFFEVVSQKITGGTVPELTIGVIIGLLVIPIGAWLIIPLLIKRNKEFGYFLLWTLFVSMGVSELAHFIFPFLTNEPYGYFPGMASVIILAPLAWWGIFRFVNKKTG